MAFTTSWGCGDMVVRNLFALRDIHPEALAHHPDPIGQANDEWLVAPVADGVDTVCTWGRGGALLNRAAAVSELLQDLPGPVHHLDLNRDESPHHQVRLPRSALPMSWLR